MITQYAFAKINFNLHVLPELLPNGYHQVNLLNLQVSLSDKITVCKKSRGIGFFCDNPNLTDTEANLAYKAAKAVMKKYHPQGGVEIYLEKNIPITSGLGGGSADAAAVILALEKLWKLKLSNTQKIDLAKTLGMDVCYCVIGGICLLTGAGEIVKPLKTAFPNLNLIIITPFSQKPSSGWAFSKLDASKVGQNLEKLNKLVEGLGKKDLFAVAQNLHNDFEEPMFEHFPEIKDIKDRMLDQGAIGTNLCGAGLSVFGIFEDQKSAQKAFKTLKKSYPQTFLTQTV